MNPLKPGSPPAPDSSSKPRFRLIRITSALFAILVLMEILASLTPLMSSSDNVVRNYLDVDGINNFTLYKNYSTQEEIVTNGKFKINWLLDGHYTLYARAVHDGDFSHVVPRLDAGASINLGALFAVIIVFAVIAGGLILVAENVARTGAEDAPDNSAPPIVSKPAGASEKNGRTQISKKWKYELPDLNSSPEEALRLEMKNAWISEQRFYNNSLFLLTFGVLMAFVGLGAFIATVPEFSAVKTDKGNTEIWGTFLIASIRPFGTLIFLEAIAWFLLRQYRSSTEDYKAFHRIYLKRSNYFTARKAYSELESSEKSLLLAAALLSEDLSGRLSSEQTTEAIEAMKVDDNNPVFATLAGLTDRFVAKSENKNDKKDSSEKSDAGKKDAVAR